MIVIIITSFMSSWAENRRGRTAELIAFDGSARGEGREIEQSCW